MSNCGQIIYPSTGLNRAIRYLLACCATATFSPRPSSTPVVCLRLLVGVAPAAVGKGNGPAAAAAAAVSVRRERARVSAPARRRGGGRAGASVVSATRAAATPLAGRLVPTAPRSGQSARHRWCGGTRCPATWPFMGRSRCAGQDSFLRPFSLFLRSEKGPGSALLDRTGLLEVRG